MNLLSFDFVFFSLAGLVLWRMICLLRKIELSFSFIFREISMTFLFVIPFFLDASSHLYTRVCPSVRPYVRPYVHPSVCPLTLRKNRRDASYCPPGLVFLAFALQFCLILAHINLRTDGLTHKPSCEDAKTHLWIATIKEFIHIFTPWPWSLSPFPPFLVLFASLSPTPLYSFYLHFKILPPLSSSPTFSSILFPPLILPPISSSLTYSSILFFSS